MRLDNRRLRLSRRIDLRFFDLERDDWDRFREVPDLRTLRRFSRDRFDNRLRFRIHSYYVRQKNYEAYIFVPIKVPEET